MWRGDPNLLHLLLGACCPFLKWQDPSRHKKLMRNGGNVRNNSPSHPLGIFPRRGLVFANMHPIAKLCKIQQQIQRKWGNMQNHTFELGSLRWGGCRISRLKKIIELNGLPEFRIFLKKAMIHQLGAKTPHFGIVKKLKTPTICQNDNIKCVCAHCIAYHMHTKK